MNGNDSRTQRQVALEREREHYEGRLRVEGMQRALQKLRALPGAADAVRAEYPAEATPPRGWWLVDMPEAAQATIIGRVLQVHGEFIWVQSLWQRRYGVVVRRLDPERHGFVRTLWDAFAVPNQVAEHLADLYVETLTWPGVAGSIDALINAEEGDRRGYIEAEAHMADLQWRQRRGAP